VKLLAQEMLARAEGNPAEIAVIDELGSHTIGSIVEAARLLADTIASLDGGAPTALIQADNTWQTVATALAIGLRGGVVAVFSPHATESEFEMAIDDIDPDLVVADADALTRWGIKASAPVSAGGFRLGRALARRHRDRDDLRFDRSPEVCRPVRGGNPLRVPEHHRYCRIATG
jgi:acyl-CoA synthetase (AMP-forming)/AMP-acid ligase II